MDRRSGPNGSFALQVEDMAAVFALHDARAVLEQGLVAEGRLMLQPIQWSCPRV